MKNIFIPIVFLFLLQQLDAKIIYIAPEGDDVNPGNITNPLASAARAQELAVAGDTIYFRGGIYLLDESDISYVYNNLFACYAFINKSGEPGKRINYWAYPGEQPILEFTDMKPAGQRVVGFYITANYVHFKGLEITGVQVTITTHTESYCFYNYGSHNIFELLKLHDNQATGIRHRKGGNNLFLNCDAYRNHDYTSEDGRGGNNDGFGCHPDKGGTGNVFRGCRAWFNSDDGYDFIGSDEAVTIENCWALYNGYSPTFQSLADGNGFKAGGDAVTAVEDLPVPIPRHVVRFCLAVRNKASGFYANHHIGGIDWINNTAYRNGTNYNMLNRLEDNETDVPGYNHRMWNNLGYKGGSELRNIDREACYLFNNYFDLDVTVNDADFKSLDMEKLTAARQEDGSLPENDFMRLTFGSDLVDAGVDVGFPFEAFYPDLGAYEQAYAFFPSTFATWYQKYSPEYYWEEGNEAHYRIYGMLGIDTLINGQKYQRLYRYKDDRLIPEMTAFAGSVREDSSKKVFYRGPSIHPFVTSDTAEVFLYDFSVGPGDIISEGYYEDDPMTVSFIDSVLIGNEWRSRINFSTHPYTKWIEGMGDERGILFHASTILDHGVWSDLVCFYENGEELFHNTEYENCYLEDPSYLKPNSSPSIQIYPNPAQDILNLELDRGGSFQLEIYNLSGRLMLSESLEGSYKQMNISYLHGGVYLLRLHNDEMEWKQFFIVE